MALVLADRVRETTTVTGTGTATLLGAVSGYQSFSAVGNANTTYYVIANQSASEWEVGIGTYTSSGTTLSRTTVLSSSNGGSLVNFTAGTKDVFVDYPASKAVYEDASGNIDSYPITGGTINGTTVGASTPATGKFSTLESTGTASLGTTSAQYIQAVGNATEPQILAVGSGTNIPLVLQPKGTGALQAQATTSSAVGGNARGANAVDFQTLRDFAVKVASGAGSVLVGGQYNQASGGQSVTVGGNNVVTSGSKAASVGGDSNTNAAQLAFLGGGYTQTLSSNGQFGFLGGGYANTLAGFYNVIGGGYTNSGTSGSAVTTQSATMNGTTAVTLSGSNANIKVGQLITGTSINSFPNTYVAAISGTSLTLSQVASGSSTSTLSFFTPHGVVVGGGNNQATGSYSFIGGGGDAGTAANRNVASGDYSVVGGGRANQATGVASVISGGGSTSSGGAAGNTASGELSFLGGGRSNVASGRESCLIGGVGNVANGTVSTVLGGRLATARGITGNIVASASESPIASSAGSSQFAFLVLGKQTTDATASVLTSDGGAGATTNQVILPNNSAYYFKGSVIANVTGGGNTKAWAIEGAIKRGANAASTALVGSVSVVSAYADAGASTWAIAVTADTTNGGLAVTFTGQASTTIRVVAKLETTEVTF